MLTHGFFGYVLAFTAILLASFIFLFGLSYWDANMMVAETSCTTSTGEGC